MKMGNKEDIKVKVKGTVNSVNGLTGDVIVEVPEPDLGNYYTKEETNELIDKVSTGEVDLTNYYTKGQTNSLIQNAEDRLNERIDNLDIPETDLSNYYTKTEVDEKIENIEITGVDLSNYYDKNETDTLVNGVKTTIPNKTSELNNDSNFITSNIDNLTNFYNKTEINGLINSVSGLQLEVVTTLPTTDIKTNAIYLVPKTSAEQDNIYDEYVYLNSKWEHIGSTAVDLSNYYTKTEVDSKLHIVSPMTQAEYDALEVKDENTYYFIVEG